MCQTIAKYRDYVTVDVRCDDAAVGQITVDIWSLGRSWRAEISGDHCRVQTIQTDRAVSRLASRPVLHLYYTTINGSSSSSSSRSRRRQRHSTQSFYRFLVGAVRRPGRDTSLYATEQRRASNDVITRAQVAPQIYSLEPTPRLPVTTPSPAPAAAVATAISTSSPT